MIFYLHQIVKERFGERKQQLGTESVMQDYMRRCTLKAIDDAWIEQVDYLQQLQTAVRGRASAQRNVQFEYQKESMRAFQIMEKRIKRNIIRNILLGSVTVYPDGDMELLLP